MNLTRQTCQPASSAEIDEHEYVWRTTVQDRLATIDLRPTGRFQRFAPVEQRDLGDLMITDWDCPDMEGIYASKMARRDAEAMLIFTVFAGRQIVETPHQTVIQRPGDVLTVSTRTAAKIVVPEMVRKRTARIPLPAFSPFDTGPDIPDCLLLDTTIAHRWGFCDASHLGREFSMSPSDYREAYSLGPQGHRSHAGAVATSART